MKYVLLAVLVTLLMACGAMAPLSGYPQGPVLENAQKNAVKVISGYSVGTGVWVSPTLILTAQHTITGHMQAEVGKKRPLTIVDAQGNIFDARLAVTASDTPALLLHDWALLRVDPDNASETTAAWTCQTPTVGEQVATWGYALGKPGLPFLGLIQSVDFNTNDWAGTSEAIWHHGLLANMSSGPGVSGAAVYNMRGLMVGIVVGTLMSPSGGRLQTVIFPIAQTDLCAPDHDHKGTPTDSLEGVALGVRG